MIRQYEIELHPLVIVTTQTAQDLLLKNIGRSAALSVQIEPLAFEPVASATGGIQVGNLHIEIIASFHPIDYLDTGEEKPVAYSCHVEGPTGIKEPFQNNPKLIRHLTAPDTKRNYCIEFIPIYGILGLHGKEATAMGT